MPWPPAPPTSDTCGQASLTISMRATRESSCRRMRSCTCRMRACTDSNLASIRGVNCNTNLVDPFGPSMAWDKTQKTGLPQPQSGQPSYPSQIAPAGSTMRHVCTDCEPCAWLLLTPRRVCVGERRRAQQRNQKVRATLWPTYKSGKWLWHFLFASSSRGHDPTPTPQLLSNLRTGCRGAYPC
jgi:hypothetical protein